MSKKTSVIKVRLFIIDQETGDILAGQRKAILNLSAEAIGWTIDADSAFVESAEAYEALTDLFVAGKDVNIRLEFSADRKYTGSCKINQFKPGALYNDLAQYSIKLQGNEELLMDASNMKIL